MSESLSHSAAPATRGQLQRIDLLDKVAKIDGYWQQRVVSEMNDYQFKVVKVEGAFPWHRHAETDETFIVLEGALRIDFRGGPDGDGTILLGPGQMAVVPKGVEHKPSAAIEVKMLVIEPRGVVNTGDGAKDERTIENDQWI